VNPPVSPQEVHSWTEVLSAGGPWTLLLGALYAVRHLYLAREADRAKFDVEKQALNDRIIAMAQKQNEILVRTTDNQKLLLAAMNKGNL